MASKSVCLIGNRAVSWYTVDMEPRDIYKEVGHNIRRYRNGAHRTQEQVAAQIGMSRASLANIEAGRQQVLVHHLYAIAAALDLDSPSVLMPPLKPPPQTELSELPLPKEGLTEKQRLEVLRLLSGVLSGQEPDTTGGDA